MIRNHSKQPIHAVHSALIRPMIGKGEVFYQSLGKISVVSMIYDRILGRCITLYFHEPYSLKERLEGVLGFSRRSVVYLEHIYLKLILFLVNKVIVDNENALLRFYEFSDYKFKKVFVAGLLFPKSLSVATDINGNSCLLLGRVDDNRNASDYIKITNDLGLHRALASSQSLEGFDGVEILNHNRKFSEEEKVRWMKSVKYIYSYFRKRYNQSGVVKEALTNQREVIISHTDSHLIPVRLFRLGIVVVAEDNGFRYIRHNVNPDWKGFLMYLELERITWQKVLR